MKFKKILYTASALLTISTLMLNSCRSSENSAKNLKISKTEVYRGFNTPLGVRNEVLDTVISITGARVIRLAGPYVKKEPPYEFIEPAFESLNRTLDWAKKNNVRICIDPHTTPGMRDRWTGYPTDTLWKDKSLRDHLIKVWVRIANEHKHRGKEIYGYDLLNEPAIPNPEVHGNQWNDFVKTLVDTIRALGDNHPIIVEPTWIALARGHKDRTESLADLVLPEDDNLIVSPHIYEPFGFTHQGVNRNPDSIPYPGIIRNEYWDKERLSVYLQPIRDFQKRYEGIPIFIGEFSASRAGGDASNVYLKDLIDLFEAEGWGWAYHDFRGGGMWDPEQPVGTNRRQPRDKDTPRMKLFRSYYSHGT